MPLKLVHKVWEEKTVPKGVDWYNPGTDPDLTKCDNWQGISLLDVVGKVVARITTKRLQQLAEEVLP